MSSIIVYINGWPGAGKYIVGRLAAARLGARLVPNHVINGPGFALADFGTPAFRDIVRKVRALVFDGIAAAPAPDRFVLTTVLIDEAADAALYDRIAGLASGRGCPFLPVTLDCALEENCARLESEARAQRASLTDCQALRDLRAAHDLLRPKCGAHLELESSKVGPHENALRIVEAADRLLAGAAAGQG